MKKTSNFKYLFVAVLLCAFSLPQTCLAETGDNAQQPSQESARKERMDQMIKELGLTADQQTKIKAIQEGNKAAFKEKKEAMKNARKSLKEAMEAGKTDEELRTLNDAVLAAQQDMAKSRFEQVLAIRKVLTPEQKKKFKGFGRRGGKREGEKKD